MLRILLRFSADKEVGAIEQAHDSIVWTLAWHPLGHILCSGSNDHTSKFWTRNRPGDLMRDKYNLNTLPAGVAGVDDVDLGKSTKYFNNKFRDVTHFFHLSLAVTFNAR